MPFEKFESYNKQWKPCLSQEHNPPRHMVYKPGTYTWRCPACGHIQTFTVPEKGWIRNSYRPYITCFILLCLFLVGCDPPKTDDETSYVNYKEAIELCKKISTC